MPRRVSFDGGEDSLIDKGKLDDLIDSLVATTKEEIGEKALASAIQVALGSPLLCLYSRAQGCCDLEEGVDTQAPPGGTNQAVSETTPFDIASLTKPLVGATLAMIAVEEGRIELDTPIREVFAPWKEASKEAREISFLDLLSHSSGLPAWRKFYLEYPLDPDPETARRTGDEVLGQLLQTKLEGAPGKRHCYSDLGFLLLKSVLEALFPEARLEDLARERIFLPLDMKNTTYVSLFRGDSRLEEAVVTEFCPLRSRLIRGEVHDENTNIIGGVSTHAGVFSTALDLLRFGQHLLAIDRGDMPENPLVSREVLHQFWSSDLDVPGSHLGGWDRPSGKRSSAGRFFSPRHTVGHLGFTGTSIWLERQRGIVSIFLSNRVYPSRGNQAIKGARVAFQEAF